MFVFEKKSLETFQPIRMYPEEIKKCNLSFEDIDVGDYVFAYVKLCTTKKVHMNVGKINAFIDIEEFDVYGYRKNLQVANSFVGLRVLSKVLEKKNGMLFLSRKQVIKESIDHLKTKIGSVVDATIEGFVPVDGSTPYGAFVDIGNGHISLLHITKFSKSRIKDLRNLFSIGDVIKVKINDYCESKNQFIISRKDAYPHIEFERKNTIVVTGKQMLPTKDALFVEYDPGNVGIMDIPTFLLEKFSFEEIQIRALIKRQTERGFKACFDGFIE